MLGFLSRRGNKVLPQEPSAVAARCRDGGRLTRRRLPALCLGWLLLLTLLFGGIGFYVDHVIFREPTLYFLLMPGCGLITWFMISLRICLAVWKSQRASDAIGSFVFLAAFVLLHVYVFQQVGLTFKGSVYYDAFAAFQRRLQVPPPQQTRSFQDIYAWLSAWADEWIPEDASELGEPHPGWTALLPPEIWTQRVAAEPCGYWGFSMHPCVSSPELADATEMTGPWRLTIPESNGTAGAERVLRHHSGTFLNFRGDEKEVPRFSGKLGVYRFQRGYLLVLADGMSGERNPMLPAANRSTMKLIFGKMERAGFIDRHTRIVTLSHTLIHVTTKQWLSLRVVFEVSFAGLIEPSLSVYQGAVTYCRFEDEALNTPSPEVVQRIYQQAGRVPGPCSGPEECDANLRQAGIPPFTCENTASGRYASTSMAYYLGMTDRILFPVFEGSTFVLVALFVLDTFLLIEEIFQMFCQGRAYFTEVSNYIEMFTIFNVYMVFERSVAQQGSTPQDGMTWELYCSNIGMLQRTCGIACFLWWMRMLNLVSSMHPRMSILIQTMQRAWLDLMFFCVMFGIVLFAFSVTFHTWFANREESFKAISSTFVTLFRGLIGDIAATPFEQSWEMAVFYMAYVILSMLIMVNVFIAIISSSFEVQQAERESRDERRVQQEGHLEQWILQDPREEASAEQTEGRDERDVLKVVLWGGRSLQKADWLGLADSYATLGLRRAGDTARDEPESTIELQLNGRRVVFESARVRSEVVEHSLDPDWCQKGLFTIPRGAAESEELELFVSLADHDHLKSDDFMGEAAVPLPELVRDGHASTTTWATKRISTTGWAIADGLMSAGGAGKDSARGSKVRRHVLKVHRGGSAAGTVEVSAVLHSLAGGRREGSKTSAMQLT